MRALVFKIFIMYTITLNGNSSELSCDIFPPLEVDKSTNISLLSLHTNNSIPNVEYGCDIIAFRKSNGQTVSVNIPTGAYELDGLESVIKKLLPSDVSSFRLEADNNTLKCTMTANLDIDFTVDNNISKLLGFQNKIYKGGITHESENLVKIIKVNCIKIECNLIHGSFCDGVSSQTIHEFFPTVSPGYKIVEVPRHLVFYSLNTTSISKIIIVLRDQDGNLINLRGEPITVRLQIKHENRS